MLPLMRYKNSVKEYKLASFGGINNSYSKRINEFSDALNMSSQNFPALSSHRAMSEISVSEDTICTAGYFDKLYTLERTKDIPGTMYICNPNTKTAILDIESEDVATKKRTFGFMSNSVLILPDNIICNTNTMTAEPICIHQQITQSINQRRFEEQSKTTKTMPMPYNVWYSAYLTSNSIVSFSSNYTASSSTNKFFSFSASKEFEIGDIVTLKMSVKPINQKETGEVRDYKEKMSAGITLKIKDIKKTTHSTPSGTISENTSLIFEDGAIDMGGYTEVYVMGMTIEKGIPNLVDICPFENRMWGITETEICASKLGDCTVWDDFTADSYGTLPSSCFKTGVETDGKFTAITAFGGNVLAFKEDCIHKIYGSEPAEFHILRTNCPGVEKNSSKTLAAVGNRLYYKGKGGIYAYNGNSVSLVTPTFDIGKYKADVAAGDDRFYCIHLFDENESFIAIYDTEYGIWHKTSCPDGLCALVRTDDGIVAVFENSIMKFWGGSCGRWHFVIEIGKREFASKHICSVFARCSSGDDAGINISIRNKHGTYDLKTIEGYLKDYPVMISIPVSCARDAELIFSGEGEFVLSSLTIRYKETGIND